MLVFCYWLGGFFFAKKGRKHTFGVATTVIVVPTLIVVEIGALQAITVTISALASVFVINKKRLVLPPPRRGRRSQRNQVEAVAASRRRREGME